MTIDILPEDVLLEIFDFYVDPTRKCNYNEVENWCTLVHVCRKWRTIVLESPLRLDLRIHCHPECPMEEKLDIWPTLPIVIEQYSRDWDPEWSVDNLAAALEQTNRICHIGLWGGVPAALMEGFLTAMDKPLPVLTSLYLESESTENETGLPTPVDPDLFLGGSAPSLRSLTLVYIPFPGLPKLLSTTSQLTDLQLYNIFYSGYISPEVIVACVLALTRLETFILSFHSPSSFPNIEHRPPPPPTRALLSALTSFNFQGVSAYLEDLVVRIDTPLLDKLGITFFHEFINTTQLIQFIDRLPKLKIQNEAHVDFKSSEVHLTFGQEYKKGLDILYEVEDWHVSSVAQVCALSLSRDFSATVESLHIWKHRSSSVYGDIEAENNHWLELLRPFTSVKSLYLSPSIVTCIAPVLQELVEERVAGVLPALQTLFLGNLNNLSGPDLEAIGSFVSGRHFSGHPVAVSEWEGIWFD